MDKIIEAIYRNGVLEPLVPLDLPEDQHVMIAIHLPTSEEPEEALKAWHQVYAGFSGEEITEVEHIVRDRRNFT